jgi:hypothetical protein
VKKAAGLFLLSVYLFSFAELHNLFKLPVLISHFREHRAEDPSISFFTFIRIHYFDPLVVDEDYQRDQQLPFRDTDCCVVTISGISELPVLSVPLPPPPPATAGWVVQDEESLPPPHSIRVFQPPRYA